MQDNLRTRNILMTLLKFKSEDNMSSFYKEFYSLDLKDKIMLAKYLTNFANMVLDDLNLN